MSPNHFQCCLRCVDWCQLTNQILATLPVVCSPDFQFLTIPGQTASPIEITTKQKEDWTRLRTFGCRVWVQPPGRRPSKFRSMAQKGMFLGHTPMTTRNFLWYDCQTNKVKIATCGGFDEGLSDLPVEQLPPNVNCLLWSEEGNCQHLQDTQADMCSHEL